MRSPAPLPDIPVHKNLLRMTDRVEGDLLTGVGCFVTVATAGDADAHLHRPGPGSGQLALKGRAANANLILPTLPVDLTAAGRRHRPAASSQQACNPAQTARPCPHNKGSARSRDASFRLEASFSGGACDERSYRDGIDLGRHVFHLPPKLASRSRKSAVVLLDARPKAVASTLLYPVTRYSEVHAY